MNSAVFRSDALRTPNDSAPALPLTFPCSYGVVGSSVSLSNPCCDPSTYGRISVESPDFKPRMPMSGNPWQIRHGLFRSYVVADNVAFVSRGSFRPARTVHTCSSLSGIRMLLKGIPISTVQESRPSAAPEYQTNSYDGSSF